MSQPSVGGQSSGRTGQMTAVMRAIQTQNGPKVLRIGIVAKGGRVIEERIIKQRGRWQSDIAFLYQRALAETHLRGSAAVADADHADLESLCLGWVQPATLR